MRRETRDGDGLTGRASAVDRTDAGPGQGGHIQESALRKTQFGGKPMGESHPSLAAAPDCQPLTEQSGKDLQPMPSRDFWPVTLRPCSGELPGRSAKPARSSISWGRLWDVMMARGSFRRRGACAWSWVRSCRGAPDRAGTPPRRRPWSLVLPRLSTFLGTRKKNHCLHAV